MCIEYQHEWHWEEGRDGKQRNVHVALKIEDGHNTEVLCEVYTPPDELAATIEAMQWIPEDNEEIHYRRKRKTLQLIRQLI